MSRIAELSDKRKIIEMRVFAYGFNTAGFHTPHESISLPGVARIEFVDLYATTPLEWADGVIIPQGIFEQIQSRPSTFGSRTDVTVNRGFLLERERQVFNLLRAGKWVCFLVGEIIDEVSQGIHLEPIRDTDLCKRILNAFNVGRRHKYHLYTGTHREVRAREKEFESYTRDYGIPTTVFEFPHLDPIERHVIIEFGQQAVGFEFDSQLFFLPFHSPGKDSPAALSIAETTARSVIRYRQNRTVELPAWVDELRFANEDDLYLEINSLLGRVNRLESQLLSWKDYKSILAASGLRLRNKIGAILESVFDLRVEQTQNSESLVITDHDQGPIFIDSRSTEGSVGKAFIDDIHEHRKIAGLPEGTPTVLLINSDTQFQDIVKRAEAAVPDEIVDYAKKLHVLIVRTIDLLLLMRHLEKDDQRGKILKRLLVSDGGWLKMDLRDSGVVK